MKKFLSILVAVAMVFSLFAGTFAPRASAAAGLTINATLDAAKKTTSTTLQYYFNSFPSPLTLGNLLAGTYVYNMGDTIHATAVFDTTTVGGQYVTELLAWDGAGWLHLIDSVTAFQTSLQATGSANEALKTYPVQIGTGNVSFDGPYLLQVREIGGDTETLTGTVVFIRYNLTWKASAIKSCAQFNTIEGWITRGNGQTVLVPVIVGVTYPAIGLNYDIAAYYLVAASSSGQFSLTFPVDGSTQIGDFAVFVRDAYADAAAYPTAATGVGVVLNNAESADNDAMIYDWLTNAPDTKLTVSTYVSPVLLYKGINDQPLLLSVMDQNGLPVTGLASDWFIGYSSTPVAMAGGDVVQEVSPGYYRFLLHPSSSQVDVRLQVQTNIYGSTVYSNTVVINLRDVGPFNPFVDVNAIYSDGTRQSYDDPTFDCDTARYVYDALPCTIGNGLEIAGGLWQVAKTDDWYIYDTNLDSSSWTPAGPVRWLKTYSTSDAGGAGIDDPEPAKWNGGTYIITEAGKITVSVSATIWERVDQDCPDDGKGWFHEPNGNPTGYIAESEMATNACCHTYEKTFNICEVKSCSLTGVTLENGAQTSATAIQVGKKADLVVNVSGANAPAGLSCGCNTKIVHIYMTQNCAKVPAAFTLDNYAGGQNDPVTDLWYNGIAGSATKRTPDMPWSPDMYDLLGNNVKLPDDGTVIFDATTSGAIIIDNCEKLIFKGVQFNFNNDQATNACGYQLVVEVFALNRSFDACGNMFVSYPFVSETLNDIDITPAVTTLTTIGTIIEAGIDPTTILAGVPVIIEATNPSFSTGTYWQGVYWTVKLNGHTLSSYYGITMTASTIDTGYRFTFNCAFPEAGDLVITGTQYGKYCNTKEIVIFTEKVVMPAFEVKIGLADGTQIANDHIITTGLGEKIYVTATDTRADGHHDFATDPNWKLVVDGWEVYNDCGLPTSVVCGSTPTGCTTPSPILVYGADNPNIEDAPQFELYFETYGCADLLVDTFTFVDPTVKATPEEVPFTIPASATHVVFTVKDAHAHGAPDVIVEIEGGWNDVSPTAGASGYTFVAGEAVTDKTGEANWAFVPPYSGKYYIEAHMSGESCLDLPCGWSFASTDTFITAKYMAPVVDTTAPVVTLAAGLDGSKVSSSMLNLTGKVTDNVGVTQLFVGFNKVDVLPDGSFMVALKLVEGENSITVVAYDAAGNKGTATAKVTYAAPVDTKIVLVLTIGADIVSVNGKATSIDAAPEIVASRTFVPIRFIAESFGATVEWLSETQGITITLGDHTVGLQIGNATAVIDGTIVSLPAAPYIKNGRTMVPLRVISEAFGGDVVWDPSARTITITYQP
jgi:hypothetical protein